MLESVGRNSRNKRALELAARLDKSASLALALAGNEAVSGDLRRTLEEHESEDVRLVFSRRKDLTEDEKTRLLQGGGRRAQETAIRGGELSPGSSEWFANTKEGRDFLIRNASPKSVEELSGETLKLLLLQAAEQGGATPAGARALASKVARLSEQDLREVLQAACEGGTDVAELVIGSLQISYEVTKITAESYLKLVARKSKDPRWALGRPIARMLEEGKLTAEEKDLLRQAASRVEDWRLYAQLPAVYAALGMADPPDPWQVLGGKSWREKDKARAVADLLTKGRTLNEIQGATDSKILVQGLVLLGEKGKKIAAGSKDLAEYYLEGCLQAGEDAVFILEAVKESLPVGGRARTRVGDAYILLLPCSYLTERKSDVLTTVAFEKLAEELGDEKQVSETALIAVMALVAAGNLTIRECVEVGKEIGREKG